MPLDACLMPISTSAPTRSTSSRSWSRSARGSARSAASTTPSSRSASSRRSSSKSFSTRAASARTCSSSSAERSRRTAAVERRNYAFEDDDALRIAPRGRPVHPAAAPADPEAVLQPEPADSGLNIQSQLNRPGRASNERARARPRARSTLHYELMHNLVIEITRLGIEVKNLKMRVESLASRLEFNERRARALESVVVYRGAARGSARASRSRQRQRQERPAAGPVAESPARRASTQRARPAEPSDGAPERTRRSDSRRRRRRRGAAAARRGRSDGCGHAVIHGAPRAPACRRRI